MQQVNHYYPFGGLFGEGVRDSNQPYKYNGKELDRQLGLDMYDYGARHYDAALGRWLTMDPLAEKYYSISTYVYVVNNPINAIDPDGRLPVFLVPLIKGAVGAVADAAAQVTVSMVNGQGFGQAMSNIDYTSVGASFVTSAIAVPGMSTTAKVVTAGAIAVDAMVDVTNSKGVETVATGEKSVVNAAIDAVSSVVPGKVVDNVTSGFNKAVSSDLTASSAATMTKETKSVLNQAQATVNSTGFQTGANAVAGYVGGVVGGQANKVVGTGSVTSVSLPPKDPIIQQNDATRVEQPIYPPYTK